MKRLNKVCHKAFRVIRVNNKKEKEHDVLYNKWTNLRTKEDAESKEECNRIENEIATKFSSYYSDKIEKEAAKIDTETGGFNSGSMWKLKKEMFPQSRDPPTAMLDRNGVLQTDEDSIKQASVEAYKYRLTNREIKPELKEL